MRRFVLHLVISAVLLFTSVWVFSGEGPANFLNRASALEIVISISLSLALVSFLFGMLFSDYSWVDRLWSTAPVLYAWVYAAKSRFAWPVVVAALIVTLWGVRLTCNFARKGGYSGREDYRWPVLRQRISHPVLWQLFNLLFICGFRIGLFILFTAPFIRLGANPQSPRLFISSSILMLAFLFLETIADQQQWIFQKAKASALKHHQVVTTVDHQADISRGFLTGGLFSLVRHPNYLGELGVWWSFYLMASSYSGSLLHWSLSGPVVLSLLFAGSTLFTESLSVKKYPEYRDYQHRVPAIVPFMMTGARREGQEEA